MLDMLTSDRLKNQETLEKKIIKFINMASNEIDSLNNLENKEDIFKLLENFSQR